MRKQFLALALMAGLALTTAGCDQGAIESYGFDSPAPSATVSAPSTSATESALTATPESASTPSTMSTPTATPTTTPAPTHSSTLTPAPAASPEPTADPAYMSASMDCLIMDIELYDDGPDLFFLRTDVPEDDSAAAGRITALVSDETIILDASSGEKLREDTLESGDAVTAYYSVTPQSTSSAQTDCFALLYGQDDDYGKAVYVRPIAVTPHEKSVVVRNQNADLDIVIPDSVEIEVYGDSEARLTLEDILPGRRLIVWYQPEFESSPGTVEATRVMADIDADTPESAAFASPEDNTVASEEAE